MENEERMTNINDQYKYLQNGGKSSHCLSHFYKRQALVRNIFQYQYDKKIKIRKILFTLHCWLQNLKKTLIIPLKKLIMMKVIKRN